MTKYDIESEQMVEKFNEVERDMLIETHPYSSDNEIGRKPYSGGHISYHWNPDVMEVVKINTWAVANGEDDVDYEFEIVGTIGRVSELENELA